MSLYRVSTDRLEPVPSTTFAAESLFERRDLQRILRQDITPLGADLLVIAEEYGEWEDCSRRIDLLCLGRDARLVVVEIKRTQDGGHMELQAIRYAAMVSSMTLEQVIHTLARTHRTEVETARGEVLDFLQVASEEEVEPTSEVRIILVSANFSSEITTAVLWLNNQGLDITCIRLRPYRSGTEVFVDATQIIPIPEAAEYTVKMRSRQVEERKSQSKRRELFAKFWGQTIERAQSRTTLLTSRNGTADQVLGCGIGRSGFRLNLKLTQDSSFVTCFMRLSGGEEVTTQAYKSLLAQKDQIEADFGGPLEWEQLPGKLESRIRKSLPGGWQTPQEEWPIIQDRIIDTLVRMDRALRRPIQEWNPGEP